MASLHVQKQKFITHLAVVYTWTSLYTSKQKLKYAFIHRIRMDHPSKLFCHILFRLLLICTKDFAEIICCSADKNPNRVMCNGKSVNIEQQHLHNLHYTCVCMYVDNLKIFCQAWTLLRNFTIVMWSIRMNWAKLSSLKTFWLVRFSVQWVKYQLCCTRKDGVKRVHHYVY